MKRALYFEAPYKVRVREEKIPRPGDNQVLIETVVSAISPGTELLIYRGEAPANLAADDKISALDGNLDFPLKYGYSTVGRVVEIGPGAAATLLDRLVFAFHPHESHFVIDSGQVEPVPDGISAADAAMLPNFETAVSLVMDGRPMIGERVAVFGHGVVGLLTTALLARMPLSALIGFDRFAQRRAMAVSLGASASLDPDVVDADGLAAALQGGSDLTYELSGNPAALDQAIAATGYAGRVVVGSWYGTRRAALNLGGRFHRSRIRLISSQVSTIDPGLSGRWTTRRRLQTAWDMLRHVGPSRLVTHRLPLSEAANAYELLDRNPGEAIQILFVH